MEGVAVADSEIDAIEKRIDDIWKANGLNWRVTSVVVTENYPDPDKSQDNLGDVRIAESGFTEEEKKLWEKGKKETNNLGGFKVFVVGNMLDENEKDNKTNGVSIYGSHTAIICQPSARNPPIGGDTWAHELGHLFGLGHNKQNGSDRPRNDLTYPFRDDRTGTNLQGEDIAKMDQTKKELDLGLPTLTQDQLYRDYQMFRTIGEDVVGDSFYDFTDITEVYFAFYILDTIKDLHITTFLDGIIPEDAAFMYSIALDSDNDPTTGGEFAGWLGIDYLIELYVTDHEVLEATLYLYPSHVPIAPLTAWIETSYKFRELEEPPDVPPVPVQDMIFVNVPIQLLGLLSDPIGIGSLIQSADGLGMDRLEKMAVPTSSPIRPSLVLNPPVAPKGVL